MLRDAKLLPSLFNDSGIFLDKIRLLNRFRQPLDRCMRMRRRYHRATGPIRKTGESSANTHRIRHIYNNTELLATYRPKDGLLALSIPGGQALRGTFKSPRLRVEVVPGVEEFIKNGGNVFCKHVQHVDPELRPAEEVLVVDGRDRLLAVGRSFFNAEEMLSFKIGVAVKVRHGVES